MNGEKLRAEEGHKFIIVADSRARRGTDSSSEMATDVESTEGESEEGGRAKDTLEGRSDGVTARGMAESVASVPRGR